MNKLINRKKKKGFTLIELIVVIAILGILAAILVPSMLGIIGDANTKVDTANARTAFSASQIAATQIATGYTSTAGATVAPATPDAAAVVTRAAEIIGAALPGTFTVTLSSDGLTVEALTYIPTARPTTSITLPTGATPVPTT